MFDRYSLLREGKAAILQKTDANEVFYNKAQV